MSVEICVEHLLTFVILDLGEKTIALHVEIILLAECLPIFAPTELF